MIARRLFELVLLASSLAAGPALSQEADPGKLTQQAKASMQARKFAAAERIYRQLLEVYPEEPGLLMNLGLALHSSGKYEDAIEQFGSALKRKPDLTPAWLLMGVGLQKLGRHSEAVGALTKTVELDPENRIARFELADALLRSNEPERAVGEFAALAEQEPSNPKLWLGLGLCYTELSRRAGEALERAAADSAYRRLLVARSEQARERYRAAFTHYRAALAADPRAPGAHTAIAEIYRATGRSEWAEAELAKIPRGIPCSERPLECAYESGDFDEVLRATKSGSTPESLYWRARGLAGKARQANERLLALPPSAASYQLLAAAEDLEGRPREAAEAWKKALELDPGNWTLLTNRLRSLSAAGLHDELLAETDRLSVRRRASTDALFYSGDALLQLGRVEEAIPRLEGALRTTGDDSRAHRSLATAYLRVGRGEEAIPHLEKLLEAGDDAALLFQLSRAYQAAGRTAAARAAIERRQKALAASGPSQAVSEILPP